MNGAGKGGFGIGKAYKWGYSPVANRKREITAILGAEGCGGAMCSIGPAAAGTETLAGVHSLPIGNVLVGDV